MATVLLRNVRLSHPALWKATDFEGDGKFKYRAALHINKTDTAQLALINKAIDEVAADTFKAQASSVLAKIAGVANKMCFIDGVRKDHQDVWVLSTSRPINAGPPAVVDIGHSDADPKFLTGNEGRVYAGCYVNAQVDFWAYNNAPYQGISCTLIGIQYADEGQAFSAVKAASAAAFAQDLSQGAGASALL